MERIVKVVVSVMLAVVAVGALVYFAPYLFMILWNDMTPKFGIDVPLTWWEVVKLWVLIGGFRWLLKTDVRLKNTKKF